MKREIRVAIRTRENSVMVMLHDKSFWQFDFYGFDAEKTAAATIAATFLTACIKDALEELHVNGDEWQFTLTFETPGAADC